MESKALDKSIAMEPVTFFGIQSQMPVIDHFDQCSATGMSTKKPRHIRRKQGLKYVIKLVKHNFFYDLGYDRQDTARSVI